MNQFDSYMLNAVRRLKDVRTRFAATWMAVAALVSIVINVLLG